MHQEGYPLSVDPTFNHGTFEVTPVTYHHQHIEAKSRNVHDSWSNAVMVIHHDYHTSFQNRTLHMSV